jgi:hypothetical protein
MRQRRRIIVSAGRETVGADKNSNNKSDRSMGRGEGRFRGARKRVGS